ncbi:unnamed protein product [Nyctereutes procyonoides]|uniref:(raccoon dog) hypothetical protein n=1 Tax=Nyctereutes procyonoides TaxID=34880 RepID=A0A811YL68_NYCPR|nr:unnamed protein product [Nyctereutes procyonoides]
MAAFRSMPSTRSPSPPPKKKKNQAASKTFFPLTAASHTRRHPGGPAANRRRGGARPRPRRLLGSCTRRPPHGERGAASPIRTATAASGSPRTGSDTHPRCSRAERAAAAPFSSRAPRGDPPSPRSQPRHPGRALSPPTRRPSPPPRPRAAWPPPEPRRPGPGTPPPGWGSPAAPTPAPLHYHAPRLPPPPPAHAESRASATLPRPPPRLHPPAAEAAPFNRRLRRGPAAASRARLPLPPPPPPPPPRPTPASTRPAAARPTGGSPLPLGVVARTAAAKTGTGTAAGAVATVALADAVAPAAPAAAAAAASPPPPSASNSEPVETGSDWEIPSRLSFQPMAPRSVWNLGLRPQPARPLAGSRHSRAISLRFIGQVARQSHLKSPHEPAASAPASFQQRFACRVGEGRRGGSKRSKEGGVEAEEGGRGAEPSREGSDDELRGGLVRAACQSSAARPRLPVPLPRLPLPRLRPQARPFRPAHWLGAFGDGEGGAPPVSWERREFERGARRRPLGFLRLRAGPPPPAPAPPPLPLPLRPPPAPASLRGWSPPRSGPAPAGGSPAARTPGTPSCFFGRGGAGERSRESAPEAGRRPRTSRIHPKGLGWGPGVRGEGGRASVGACTSGASGSPSWTRYQVS